MTSRYGQPVGMRYQASGWGGPPAQWTPGPYDEYGGPGHGGGLVGPPGLQYLAQVDQLLVHQQVELFEALTNWQTNNRYQIKNSLGQQIYYAHEESDTCARQCCGENRGFVIHITDNNQQEVMRVTRDFKCCAGCGWCAGADACALEVTMEAPVGNIIGYVRQAFSPWPPRFTILDANRTELLSIEGPCCICEGICCTWDQEFNVTNLQRSAQVGQITKQWAGFCKEWYTQADNFTVSFPMDMDVRVKATMLAAVFLIDFMYFERKQSGGE
ncbi:phospholipid scramblase 1-like [Amphiura filiformis]|uniref:phospholipid scramblase 1-like n=1 Tax=Amphiura filiformis TaxID=82378 RepID=UPI003B21FE63